MSEGKPARRWKKGLLGLLVVLVAVCLVIAIALATGIPQQKLAVKLLSDKLKGKVQISGLSTLGQIKIAELKAFGKDAPEGAQPMLDVSGVTVEYALRPADKRFVTSVQVDKAAVTIDRTPPAATPAATPAAPKPKPKPAPSNDLRFEGPAMRVVKKYMGKVIPKFDENQFLPKEVKIAALNLDATLAAGGIAVDGLRVNATVKDRKSYTADVAGENLKGSAWLGPRTAAHDLAGGAIDFHYESRGPVLDPLKIVVPGLADIEGTIRVKDGAKIALTKCLLQDVDTQATPYPVRFKKLDLSGTLVQGDADTKKFTISMPGSTLSVDAEDLAIGPKGQEYYEGNLSIHGSNSASEGVDFPIDVVLNRGQKLQLKLEGKLLTAFTIEAGLENWSRDDVLAAVPPGIRSRLSAMDEFQGIASAKLASVTTGMSLAVDGSFKPVLARPESSGLPLEATMHVTGSVLNLAVGGELEATLGLKLGTGTVQTKCKLPAPSAFGNPPVGVASQRHFAATIEGMDLNQLAQILTGSSLMEGLVAQLGGGVELDANRTAEAYKAVLDLNVAPLKYGPVAMPDGQPVPLKGDVAFDGKNGMLTADNLQLNLGEGTALALEKVSVSKDKEAAGSYTFKTDFKTLDAMGLLRGAEGSASIAGAFKYSPADNVALAGEGEIQLAKAVAGGAVLRDVKGPIKVQDGTIKAAGLQGSVLGGTLDADAEAGLLTTGVPMAVTAHLKGVNLETLSQALGMPSVQLGGLADAELTVAANMHGVSDLRVSAQSAGEVSVGVALLEQVLASEYASQMPGKKQIERVVADLKGKGDRATFASAKLTVAYQGERVALKVELASDKLNLNLDLAIDAPLVWQALSLAGDNALKNAAA